MTSTSFYWICCGGHSHVLVLSLLADTPLATCTDKKAILDRWSQCMCPVGVFSFEGLCKFTRGELAWCAHNIPDPQGRSHSAANLSSPFACT